MRTFSAQGVEIQEFGNDRDFAIFVQRGSVEELVQEKSRLETFLDCMHGVHNHVSEIVQSRYAAIDQALQLEEAYH